VEIGPKFEGDNLSERFSAEMEFCKIDPCSCCSHELQTCDWPRNVVCRREPEKPLAEGELERIPRRLNPKVNPAIEVRYFSISVSILNSFKGCSHVYHVHTYVSCMNICINYICIMCVHMYHTYHGICLKFLTFL
jgi:hypothetical protein